MAAAPPAEGLHGRAVETRALGKALDVLPSSLLTIILVEGEAGIGKTRLLSDTLDHARDRGFQVSFGCGEELERARPVRRGGWSAGVCSIIAGPASGSDCHVDWPPMA